MPTSDQAPVVLITGAARRIGASIARTLHAAGYNLALHFRSSDADMQALCAELEAERADSTLSLQADLTDVAAAPVLVEAAVARFGRLDGLVNNAASYYATPLAGTTAEQWDHLLSTNARAPFFLALAAAKHLGESRGAIINIADIYAERPLPGHAVYSISKAALVMATRALAGELGPKVRVNAVAPGNVLWSTNPVKAETPDMVEERTALERQGSPEDIAAAVLYLLRDATYTTGTVLPVDGGRLLHI
ncbi:MAG TPA: pteridine reductase [Oleiagrimonas sp.]|nr:pteridine reductase [Oleiagrimonas sp.]